MTELTITPKTADKTARFKGAVAAGEHVAVTIKGGAEWLGDDNGAHLSLRVLDLVTGRTLAIFPRPTETISEPSASADEWSTAGEDDTDLFCNLNLNTDRMVAAARHMLRVPVLFVLGAKDEANPATTRTLYFRDRYEVEFWPERVGDDTPYDLDKWPKQIDEWTELVAEFETRLETAEADIEQAKVDVESAIAGIPQTVGTAVARSNSGKADKVAGATAGNLAALGANGNLTDSGKKPADFADATQFTNHKNDTNIHINATERSTWNAKYAKPQDGIPKSDLAEAVRTSLGKADTAIQEHQSLAAYVNGGVYDGDAKKILLKHDSMTVAEIDATAFIKDGMISEVKIVGDNLVVVFNADAGKESISIPLTQIFNPANYYDKTAADNRFVQKEAGKGLSANDYTTSEKQKLEGIEAGANKTVVDAALSGTSTNPVQNKAVKEALDAKLSRSEAEAGFTEWTYANLPAGATITVPPTYAGTSSWDFVFAVGSVRYEPVDYAPGDEGATSLEWVMMPDDGESPPVTVTATRTRLPTMADMPLLAITPLSPQPQAQLMRAMNPHLAFRIDGVSYLVPQSSKVVEQLLALEASFRYALVDVTLHNGDPYVPPEMFPIVVTHNGATTTYNDATGMSFNSELDPGNLVLMANGGAIAVFDATTGGFIVAGYADMTLTFGDPAHSPTSADAIAFTQTATLADRAVNTISTYNQTSIDIELPEAVTVDGVSYARDFFLDIDNSFNASDLALEFTGLGVDYAFVPLEDDSISEMMTIGAGERVRLYFTETPYTTNGSLPVINVARVTLGDFVTSTTTQGGN